MNKTLQKRKKPAENPLWLFGRQLLQLVLPKKPRTRKILLSFMLFAVLVVGSMYGIARHYMAKHAGEPLVYGATFTPEYARYFRLDPQQTLDAAINDLGLRRFRFVSYWDVGEPQPGQYDFSDLDWQFKKAEESGSKVSLALGLRQPRWPECHMPRWAAERPKEQWSADLKVYIGKVIDRYKNSPALVSYQLENEYFLKVFGNCPDHSKERLVDEFNFVKQKDPSKPLIVTRSDNAVPSWPVGQPRADMIGASIYKRVWDKTVTNRYFEYPFPAWFYAFLAGGAEITTGRNTFIHELQTEAWLPDNKGFFRSDYRMNDVNAIPEQNKSLNAERLKSRLEYGRATGMRTIDLWGLEWWYWRKEKAHDPSLWDVARQEIRTANN